MASQLKLGIWSQWNSRNGLNYYSYFDTLRKALTFIQGKKMKKLFVLLSLGSFAYVSADQFQPNNNSGASWNNGNQQQCTQTIDKELQNTSTNSQKAVSDQDLNKKIQESLSSGWFSKGFQNVTSNVNNGIVDLKGSVDTIENKNKVEDSVKKIEGVKQVNNQIIVAKESGNTYSDADLQASEKKFPQDGATTPQDRQINAKIRNKLNNGLFSKGNETFTIKTNNGAVTITGNVKTLADVEKLSDQFSDIQGVKSVNNKVTVKNQ